MLMTTQWQQHSPAIPAREKGESSNPHQTMVADGCYFLSFVKTRPLSFGIRISAPVSVDTDHSCSAASSTRKTVDLQDLNSKNTSRARRQ